jgi:hypothetical protein
LRIHNIKKLEGVPSGEGQYRLALGRWRFRYDVLGQVVLLSIVACAGRIRISIALAAAMAREG